MFEENISVKSEIDKASNESLTRTSTPENKSERKSKYSEKSNATLKAIYSMLKSQAKDMKTFKQELKELKESKSKSNLSVKSEEKKEPPSSNNDKIFKNRRSTAFGFDPIENEVKDVPKSTTMVTEYIVPPDHKMNAVTPRSYRKAKLNYHNYKKTGLDQTKKLYHYIELDILKKGVDNEEGIGSELSKTLTYERIYELDDSTLEVVIARLLCPKSHKEYEALMKKSITKVKPLTPDYKKLSVFDYNKNMHQPVSNLIAEFRDYDALFRLGLHGEITEKNFPKMRYGKTDSENPIGVFKICLWMLGKFHAGYESYMEYEKLQSYTKMDDFLDALRKANNELSQLAIKVDLAETKLQPVKSDKKSFGFHDDNEDVYDELREKKKAFFRPAAQKGTLHAIAERKSSNHRMGKIAAETDSDEDIEVISESEDSLKPDPTATEYNSDTEEEPKAERKKKQAHTDEEEDDMDLLILQAAQMNSYQKKGEEKKPAQNICFDLFFKGVCSAQKEGRRCEYSHDTAELVKYGKLQTEKYNNAPGMKSLRPQSAGFKTK